MKALYRRQWETEKLNCNTSSYVTHLVSVQIWKSQIELQPAYTRNHRLATNTRLRLQRAKTHKGSFHWHKGSVAGGIVALKAMFWELP